MTWATVNLRERNTARRGRWWCTQRLQRSLRIRSKSRRRSSSQRILSSIRANRVALCGVKCGEASSRQRAFIKGGKVLLGYHRHGGGGVVLEIHQIHHHIRYRCLGQQQLASVRPRVLSPKG